METEKLLFRTIQNDDLSAIFQIAAKTGPGFSSLPQNIQLIEKKILRSRESFQEGNAKEAGIFFFVLEDLHSKTIVGTAAIEASVSYCFPYFNYEVATLIQKNDFLKTSKIRTLLFLENNYQNASVLCTLYLDKNYRGKKRGEFLSRARCLFIAEFPHLFSDMFIAIMRGRFEENGESLFWSGLGFRFFDMPLDAIYDIVAKEGSKVIEDLMPRYPIYSCLLPRQAEEVIGKTHVDTEAAKHVLEKEGFLYRNYIDIYDAGPILEVNTAKIQSVRESQKGSVLAIKDNLAGNISMISNRKMDFKATLGIVERVNENEVVIEATTADILGIELGDSVRYLEL